MPPLRGIFIANYYTLIIDFSVRIIMKTRYFLAFASLLFVSFFSDAQDKGGQFKTFHKWEVHYIAFPSTILKPEIAKHYGLKRSDYSGVVNISVLNKSDKKAQKVVISGVAKNLIGHKETLEFKQIVEGESIYYLAPIEFSNEELYRFEIHLQQGKQKEKLVFQQKFYAN